MLRRFYARIKWDSRIYIIGMVMTHTVWEMVAIAAPVVVSPPYAAGKTTVFNPRGVAKAKRHIVKVISSAPNQLSSKMNIAGSRKRRRTAAI